MLNPDSLLSILTYSLLGLAFASLWMRRTPMAWGMVWVLGLAAGWYSGRVQTEGVLALLVFGTMAAGYYRPTTREPVKAAFKILIPVAALLLFHHQVPGFDNWKVLDDHRFADDSIPYNLYLNFDKATVGLFLLAFGLPLMRNRDEWKRVIPASLPAFALGCAVILALSYALGYVRFDPKFPGVFVLWAVKMLLFTCIPEEVLFRGFVQRELLRRWEARKGGTAAALITASVLFGLDHFSGGPLYILLATVAGLFYGWVYVKTERIEASILFHFTLNTLHLLLFSYPALASVVE
jgi:membrane protease YdiL (CAAX protease family)